MTANDIKPTRPLSPSVDIKPVMLATHSGGQGQKMLMDLRVQLSHLGCTVIGHDIATNKDKPLNRESVRSVLMLMGKMIEQTGVA